MIFDISSSAIGFIMIIIAWILQLVSSYKGNKNIRKRTLIMYNLGVAWLVIDSIIINNLPSPESIFNLIILIITSIILIRISNNQNKESIKKNIKKKNKR